MSATASKRGRFSRLWRWLLKFRVIRWVVYPLVHALNLIVWLMMRSSVGARILGSMVPDWKLVACSNCFSDFGLRLDAERIGHPHKSRCPNCGSRDAKKLTLRSLQALASQFFVQGSVHRTEYGSAPLIQFNEHQYQRGDYSGPDWLQDDIDLVQELANIGLFHYGPRLWMVGAIDPLEQLQDPHTRPAIIDRIIGEYPVHTLPRGEQIYRLRTNPNDPMAIHEFDSPPAEFLGRGRLDCPENPILYCTQDIEGSVHECRVTVEDELYLGILDPTRNLRLLDLSALLREDDVTEFESLDMAVHMLFFATKHSYEISRAIALSAREAGFDGLIYPSYFSQVRSGAMPFETVYGLSVRRFPQAENYAKASVFPNIALFGRPLSEGLLNLVSISRVILHKVSFELRFGPARQQFQFSEDDEELLY